MYQYKIEFLFFHDQKIGMSDVDILTDYITENVGAITGISYDFNEEELPEQYAKKYISFSINSEFLITDFGVRNMKYFCYMKELANHIRVYKIEYDEDVF